jgi:hypothetical protein
MSNEYNFYYSSEFKGQNETNSDFNIILNENLIIEDYQRCFLKVNNISFLNNLLNISQYHLNDYFEITHDAVISRYYLTDGNYNIYTFKDTVNNLIKNNHHVTLEYDNILSKYSFHTSSGSVILDPCNLKPFFGLSSTIIITTTKGYGELLDFRSFNKILLTTSLTLKNNPYNNLIGQYSGNEGIGSLILWIDKNDIPFKTITYKGEILNEIVDKNIKYINFKILNEYRENIKEMPNIQIQFQLIVKNKYLL